MDTGLWWSFTRVMDQQGVSISETCLTHIFNTHSETVYGIKFLSNKISISKFVYSIHTYSSYQDEGESEIKQTSLAADLHLNFIIIHQTHYEKSDWSRAFNQFTIACELDMINAISAADIAFIMSGTQVCAP